MQSQNDRLLVADLDHVLEHTHDLWGELQGERLFITGGTGFFGCWLLESFTWAVERLGLDAQAYVLTRSPEAFYRKAPHLAGHKSVSLIKGDVRTFAFPEGQFSHVIHAATDVSANLNAENPLFVLDTIVEGTRQTLKFAKACSARKFLLTSSGAVYGKQPSEITHISEDYTGAPDPLDPQSVYGEGKRMAEQLCTLYAQQSNIDMKIARCFAFVGPYLQLDGHFAIGNFIRDGLKGRPIVIKGDGTPYRSYLYAADLAIWLWKILVKGTAGAAYNVGSETGLSIASLADLCAEILNIPDKIIFNNRKVRIKNSVSYIPSTKRARDNLDLEEWIDLRSAIYKTVNWYS